ncbi:MAG: hypothetical protein AABM33_05930 [Pseudomonadota bacterium]
MNTRNNAAGADANEAELAGLSLEERDALAADDDGTDEAGATADLGAAAGGDDDAAEVARVAAEQAAAAKATIEKDAALKAAAEKAEADAKADAKNEDKAEAARVAREAAEASATALAASNKAAEEAKAAAERKAADDKAAAAAGTDDDDPFVSTYVAPPVEDYEKKVVAFDTRVTEASDKFKAGDMTLDEYNAERSAVEKDRRELDAAKQKADIASEMQVQTAEQRWTWEINRFYRRIAKDDGINYVGSTLLLSALDTRVKELANMKENADKDSTWFLEEAHRQVKAELGIGKKAAGGDDAAQKAAAEAKAKADAEAKKKAAAEAALRRPARAGLPKDLGGLPAAGADADAGGDEFASLDALEGMDLENALARLPKEKADRYLAAR